MIKQGNTFPEHFKSLFFKFRHPPWWRSSLCGGSFMRVAIGDFQALILTAYGALNFSLSAVQERKSSCAYWFCVPKEKVSNLNFIDDSLSCWRKQMTYWHAATSATAAAASLFIPSLPGMSASIVGCFRVSVYMPLQCHAIIRSPSLVAQVLRRHVIDIGRAHTQPTPPLWYPTARWVGWLLDLPKLNKWISDWIY